MLWCAPHVLLLSCCCWLGVKFSFLLAALLLPLLALMLRDNPCQLGMWLAGCPQGFGLHSKLWCCADCHTTIVQGVEDNGHPRGLDEQDLDASLGVLRSMAAEVGAQAEVLQVRGERNSAAGVPAAARP